MKTQICSLLLGALLATALAPVSRAADLLKTSAGDLTITPIHHASLMLQFAGKVIHVDPWSEGNYSSQPRADYIFVTDIHGDHLDAPMIEKLKKESTVIVGPAAVADKLHGVTVMKNGDKKNFGSFDVEAVPMYNLQRGPQPGALYHDKGRGNGYIFTMGGKRIYISGDTEAIPEMKALRNIDVAFVCMNLPYTMTVAEAADAVKAFRPKIVYPYHYQKSDVNAFAAALKNEKGIEVRQREWY